MEHLSIETSKQTHGRPRYLHLANVPLTGSLYKYDFYAEPNVRDGQLHNAGNVIDVKGIE